METMTYDEMSQLHGGGYVCAIAAIGFTAAEIGLIGAIPSGGWSLFVTAAGMSASLFGMMYGCGG
jgi:hypothetical protein